MKLWELTTMTNEDGTQVVRVSGRVADHADPEAQKEWIAFQIGIDVPTVRNDALLRQEALQRVIEILRDQALHFGQLGDQYRLRQ